jgi:choline monooxygenase
MIAQDHLKPEAYTDVRKPLTQASNLPPSCYTSREWYDLEVERMWLRNWLLIGRLEEVPNPGDFHRVTIVGQPLIMVRGKDGKVRVLSAICRHKGCVVKEGSGHAKTLSCPYHGWTYDLAGALIAAPGMDEAENFDKGDFGLIPVATEIWGGFVFANLAPKPRPILETLGGLAERFKSYRFEEMRIARKAVNRLDANWKLWLENSREGYHAPVVHAKSYSQFYQNRKSRGWAHSGRRGIFEIVSSSNDDGLLLPRNSPFAFVEGLSEEDKDTTHFVLYYPHLLLNIAPSHIHLHQMFPEGPDATTVVTWFCFPERTVERPDFAKEVPRYYESPDSAMIEDKEICAKTQEGLHGALSRPGRFAVLEEPCYIFANWLLDAVFDEATLR